MRRVKVAESSEIRPKLRPASTPEARENQLIALAMDVVEQRLRDGTATSQEVVHFLKLGSLREELEREKLRHENMMLEAKKKHLESQAQTEKLYADALNAMRRYSGNGDSEDGYSSY